MDSFENRANDYNYETPETPFGGNEFKAEDMSPFPDMTETAAAATTASSGFLDTNTLISKVSFILLVFFLFILGVKFGTQLITSISNPSQVTVINGMVDGQTQIIVPQDPSQPNAITLQRSNNAPDGIEFTYSVWLFLENTNGSSTNVNPYQHIFSKGSSYMFTDSSNNLSDLSGVTPPPSQNYIINAPGVYLKNQNQLIILMNTFESIYDNVQVDNLPLNKWFNLIIRCEQQTMDVFINANITHSITLVGVPRQNYGDVNIAMNGGFNGYLSNLTYYSYALGTKAIDDIVMYGPNTTASSLSLVKDSYNQFLNSNYISTNWYYGMGGNGTSSSSLPTTTYSS
jgi:hypothetical protein